MDTTERTQVIEMNGEAPEAVNICGYFDLPDDESDLMIHIPAESRTPSSVRPGLIGTIEGR